MSNYSSLSQILLPFWVQTKFEEKSLLFSSMSNSKRYMADITLYCYFLGTLINSAIPVDIGEMTCVEGVDVPIEKFSFGHLKKQILPNNNEANKLKLWKFETPFKKDNEKLKLLNENFYNDTDLEQELGEDLSPGELIRMIFPVGYIFSPNHIHIIVQPPSSPTITGPDEKKILNFIKQLSDIDTSQNVFIVPKLPGIEKDTIIYNRKCYSYLRDFILKDKRYKRYCIIRNPGIGKTYFRWLMLVELLKQNKSIVIDYKGFTAFINPKNHSVQMITNEYEYRRFAEQENVVCIIDGVPPKINHDFTGPKLIMISSPKKELIKNFTKAQRTKTLYMPTWKWSEILSYYNYIYNKNADFTQQLLKEKFTLCSRNARVIFNPETSLESIKADIDIAMTLVSGKVLEYQGEPFIGDELTHRLAHIYTNDDETITDNLYTKSICYFASKYIANLVFNKLNEKETKMLIKFVESAKDIKELKGFLGQIFEMITHLIFHKGVNFTICRLDQFDQPSHNDVRNFGTLEEKVYNKVEEINEKEKYYRPSAKNAESINS